MIKWVDKVNYVDVWPILFKICILDTEAVRWHQKEGENCVLFMDSYRCHMMASVVNRVQDCGVAAEHRETVENQGQKTVESMDDRKGPRWCLQTTIARVIISLDHRITKISSASIASKCMATPWIWVLLSRFFQPLIHWRFIVTEQLCIRLRSDANVRLPFYNRIQWEFRQFGRACAGIYRVDEDIDVGNIRLNNVRFRRWANKGRRPLPPGFCLEKCCRLRNIFCPRPYRLIYKLHECEQLHEDEARRRKHHGIQTSALDFPYECRQFPLRPPGDDGRNRHHGPPKRAKYGNV